ncbi:hypothetical protein HHI36_023948 [Cryptolaemus montrouzieri]|uniref:Uncharacterized protein n=1 Tax=Cryptolaemus montrouzieri TaxID=559131 RepID=A0ABD2PHX0_9CUCU
MLPPIKNGEVETGYTTSLRKDDSRNKYCTFFMRITKIILLVLTLAISIYILLNVHQPTASLVLRNVQGLIYPGLKILRFFSVPVIRKFPSLTDLYDESCLLENPYFYVHEMECWPCQDVYSVTQLTSSINQSTYLSGTPYVTRSSQQVVPFAILKNLYKNNQALFDQESSGIKSTSYKISDLKDVFNKATDELGFSEIHVSWRINRMTAARVIRKLFPRPAALPERSGQSVERYVMIDGAKAPPYPLPNMECSFISVKQANGQRTIVLKPSAECNRECRMVSVVLQPSDILWYNWWYWRPISFSVEATTEISISYISSYC